MIEETSTSPFPASSPAAGTSTSSPSATSIGTGSAGSAMHPERERVVGTSTGTSYGASERVSESAQGTVRRVAQRAHEAVDRLEQSLGAGSERMMDLEQEWSSMAREQVRARPLAAIGVAFLAGIMVNKLFMR